MGRPLGSKNRVNTAPPAPASADGQKEGSYVEGGGMITIPRSNSSAALFPEQISEPEPQQPEPKPDQRPQETVPAQPEQQPDQPSEPEIQPEQPQPQSEEVVYLEDLLQKMNIDPSKVKTKTKIDGVEGEASILDVKKSYQLEQHLTKRGQKIGEERRQLEAMRNELMRQTQQKPVEEDSSTADPAYTALRQELEQLKSVLPSLEPVIYQTARQKVADDLKAQGFPDFMDYIGKIDTRVAAESDENKWRFYNTPDGAKQLYFQIKLEEQRNGVQSKPNPQQPRIEPIAPPKKPPIVKIDGGSQPSQGNVDDYNVKMSQLMKEWRETKNKAVLQEILRLKGALTFQ